MRPLTPDSFSQSPILNRYFTPTPYLTELQAPQARLVRAFRLAVLFGKAGRCPIAQIAPMIGGVASAVQFVRVVQMMGAHWAEPIRIYRPCCPQSSPDEILMLDLINAMVMRDAVGLRALLSDLLPDEAITTIQSEIAAFVANHIRPRHAV